MTQVLVSRQTGTRKHEKSLVTYKRIEGNWKIKVLWLHASLFNLFVFLSGRESNTHLLYSMQTHYYMSYMSYSSRYLHELRHTLFELSHYPFWATHTVSELHCALSELRRTLSAPVTSHPFWATPHPLWSTPHPLWSTPHPLWSTPHPESQRWATDLLISEKYESYGCVCVSAGWNWVVCLWQWRIRVLST